MIAHRLKVGMVVAAVWCAAAGGSCGPRRKPGAALESVNPNVRAAAAVQIAEHGDESAIPRLVDRLEDEDPAVRFFAILALERLTGTRLGFAYGGSAEERRAAVERWRQFVLERGMGDRGREAEPLPATEPVSEAGPSRE